MDHTTSIDKPQTTQDTRTSIANRLIPHLDKLPSPCFVIDEEKLQKNAKLLESIQLQTGCKIIAALKAFSTYSTFPIISPYLAGSTSSSLHEAKLASETFGKDIHIYAPAYKDKEIAQILKLANHITFNSISQWHRFKQLAQFSGKQIHCGIRLNPEHSEVDQDIYNPCVPFSRLGVTQSHLDLNIFDEGITGIHFHTLCSKYSDSLERTLAVVEEKFSDVLHKVQWVNFGGGHKITCPDYDVDHLCELINHIQTTYNVQVILEPGEAVALNTGVLVSTVLDIFDNGMDIAILDTSATAHMPDILEMPYRAEIQHAGMPGEFPFTYKLGGVTCLSGDIIGDYSFKTPLSIGDQLIFHDMAHYTAVKTTTFNGVALPGVAVLNPEGDIRVEKTFGYADFKRRL